MELTADTVELFLRVASALGLGAAIGLERQWRSRMAGIRTNALVSGGSALFVVLGAVGVGDNPIADPTRVAAQVVSGIGFLGAGVILRDGLNIRGLNTAATLWCSAAIGSLSGFGLYWMAAFGAAAIVASNTALRPVSRFVARRRAPEDNPVSATGQVLAHYLFEVRTTDKNEQRIRALVLQATNGPGLSLRSIETLTKKNSQIAFRAEVAADTAEGPALERALQQISLDPKVLAVRWWDADEND